MPKQKARGEVERTWCGRCLLLFFCLMACFCCWVLWAIDFDRFLLDGPDRGHEQDPPLILETDRLPMISADKRVIYVVSEEGLPIANNFILRNPSIPIEKIVYKKPGENNSIHVYPIQRDALIATSDCCESEISVVFCAFLLLLIFTTFGMYLIFCYDVCNCRPAGSRTLYETCFEFDPTTDLADLDDLFGSSSSDSSAANTPVKKQKKIKSSKGCVKITITDELKRPLLSV